MATLKLGYDSFAASSQAGTDASIPGILLAETAKQGKHKVRVQRTSDSFYYNATTATFAAPAPAEADELDFQGSDSERGIHPAIRRLKMRLPTALAAAGEVKLTVYASGDLPATGKTITVPQL